ncbi:hypothetical protein [Streptomyces sp. NRRL F-5727]|uniref:hypothetical protein n=1 Tax=Streptomyces sp. NRRL F-5727 TaxID=1463871 RepID=UPI0004C4AB55|nr:hypothetical protein [Streptomyces sp. NRRL F-5727]
MSNTDTELIAGELHIAHQHGWSTDEPTWAILTIDAAKAADLAALLGGRMREAQGQDGAAEVILGRSAVEATLTGPSAFVCNTLRRRGLATVEMDQAGSAALTRSEAGKANGRTRTCDEMVKARAGTGSRPAVSLMLSIAGVEDLGVFRLTSESWDFSEAVRALSAEVVPPGGRVRVAVRIHTSRMTTRSGVAVVFVQPQLVVLDSFSENVHWSLAA